MKKKSKEVKNCIHNYYGLCTLYIIRKVRCIDQPYCCMKNEMNRGDIK